MMVYILEKYFRESLIKKNFIKFKDSSANWIIAMMNFIIVLEFFRFEFILNYWDFYESE